MDLSIIQSKIYEIRGQRVMLDVDLAEMYGTQTAQLKRAVRRNIERFDGDDFMFEVTKEELSRYQIGILNKGRGSNIKYLNRHGILVNTNIILALRFTLWVLRSLLGSGMSGMITRGISACWPVQRVPDIFHQKQIDYPH